MPARRILAMIMAGGRGSRLNPLTRHQVKPAVPFGGKYRIIDFVLSNFVNSGVYSLYALVQYRSQALIEHLRTGWRSRGMIKDHFLAVVPPQMYDGAPHYRGTADALAQNLNLIQNYAPDVVAVFGADHVFRMDVQQMVQEHMDNRADVTISAMPVDRMEATRFGVLECDLDGRVNRLDEKPASPSVIPGTRDLSYASMGNFLFRPAYLIEILSRDQRDNAPCLDLSADLLPAEVDQARIFAYDFSRNVLPGEDAEDAQSYWRDIGTIQSYFEAHMDLVREPTLLDLDNPLWPIRAARFNSPPTRLRRVEIENALIGEGGRIQQARLRNAVIGRGVRIDPGADVQECVIMDRVTIGAGARVRRAILDSHVAIEEGEDVSPESVDARHDVHIDEAADLVVLPQPMPSSPFPTATVLVEEEYF